MTARHPMEQDIASAAILPLDAECREQLAASFPAGFLLTGHCLTDADHFVGQFFQFPHKNTHFSRKGAVVQFCAQYHLCRKFGKKASQLLFDLCR